LASYKNSGSKNHSIELGITKESFTDHRPLSTADFVELQTLLSLAAGLIANSNKEEKIPAILLGD
jgi:hypothetical protein